MTRAVIVQTPSKDAGEMRMEAELTGERKTCLKNESYTREELEPFRVEQEKRFLRRAESRNV